MKTILVLSALLAAQTVFASGSGFVTPSELTITFTSLSVIKTDDKQVNLLSGSYPTVFRRSDTDFAAVSLAGITAPEGRFNGVRICYDTDRSVKLSGNEYRGPTTATLTDGDLLYSIGTVSTANNSITETLTASPTTMTGYVVGNGTNNCSDSYFATPVCVSADASHCQTGDTRVDPGTTVPNLNIMIDLFNSVSVDATNLTLDNHIPVYPYPTIGRPGAAIHMTSPGAGSALGNISLLFGSDKKLLYAAAYQTGGVDGFCSGNGFVTATAAPAGSVFNAYGPTAVSKYDVTANKVQFAAGNSGTGSTSVSGGMNTITSAVQALNANPTVTCVADSAADPAFLGFTYTTGAGNVTASATWTIKKVIDPSNIFGVCTPGPSCGTY